MFWSVHRFPRWVSLLKFLNCKLGNILYFTVVVSSANCANNLPYSTDTQDVYSDIQYMHTDTTLIL